MKRQTFNYNQEFSYWKFPSVLVFCVLLLFSFYMLNSTLNEYFSNRSLGVYILILFSFIFVFCTVGIIVLWLKSKHHKEPITLRVNTMSFPKNIFSIIKINYNEIDKLHTRETAHGESITICTKKNKHEFYIKYFDSRDKYFDFKMFMETIVINNNKQKQRK